MRLRGIALIQTHSTNQISLSVKMIIEEFQLLQAEDKVSQRKQHEMVK